MSLSIKQTKTGLPQAVKTEKKKHLRNCYNISNEKVWYILRKKETTCELSKSKRPGRTWNLTLLHACRISSMVKRNPFTTANQVNNTLQEIGVLISKSTIKETA